MSWLSRDLITGPYLALVLSEKDYHKVMHRFKVPVCDRPRWVMSDHADATMHTLETPGKEMACLVALRVRDGISGIQIATLLVHESVHIFQEWCSRYGERNPSPEFEAYSIQAIAQRLMESYAQQTGAVA